LDFLFGETSRVPCGIPARSTARRLAGSVIRTTRPCLRAVTFGFEGSVVDSIGSGRQLSLWHLDFISTLTIFAAIDLDCRRPLTHSFYNFLLSP
jgi:hypothetical protein